MSEAIHQLNSIKANLDRLLRNYTALRNENAILKNQLEAQRKALAGKNVKITDIEQQLNSLKTAQQISRQLLSSESTSSKEEITGEGRAAMKHKINELIKEVDKCIALLNN